MKKLIIIAVVLISVTIGGIMATKPTHSPTKIPYNNGFYAGPYNPKLPVIDPKK